MKQFNWSNKGGEYVLDTVYGKATILEKAVPGYRNKYKYFAFFQASNGEVTSLDRAFSDFARAEEWVFFTVIMEYDQSRGKGGDNLEKLIATLDYCKHHLPKKMHRTHFQRLDFIKEILQKGVSHELMSVRPPLLDTSLDWIANENEFSSEIPFGTAYILEMKKDKRWHFGDVYSYRPRIVHSTGALIQGHTFSNFETAEEWVIQKLNELENPTGRATDLENLIFTLDICASLLITTQSPIHYIRLSWINMRLYEILL